MFYERHIDALKQIGRTNATVHRFMKMAETPGCEIEDCVVAIIVELVRQNDAHVKARTVEELTRPIVISVPAEQVETLSDIVGRSLKPQTP